MKNRLKKSLENFSTNLNDSSLSKIVGGNGVGGYKEQEITFGGGTTESSSLSSGRVGRITFKAKEGATLA